jgi:hypothetical protein
MLAIDRQGDIYVLSQRAAAHQIVILVRGGAPSPKGRKAETNMPVRHNWQEISTFLPSSRLNYSVSGRPDYW